jgi:hypothetical protein
MRSNPRFQKQIMCSIGDNAIVGLAARNPVMPKNKSPARWPGIDADDHP